MCDKLKSVWAEKTCYTTVDCPECGHSYGYPKDAHDDEIIGSVEECRECGTKFRIYGIEGYDAFSQD